MRAERGRVSERIRTDTDGLCSEERTQEMGRSRCIVCRALEPKGDDANKLQMISSHTRTLTHNVCFKYDNEYQLILKVPCNE